MPRIVIASGSEASRTQISRLLTASGFAPARLCASGGALRRALVECEDGVAILVGSTPDCLPDGVADDFGDRFRILMIARPEALSACESPLIFRLSYPCSGGAVLGAVEMLSQLHAMGLPRREGEDRALIERAKARLMKKRGMSEAEAHRHLQRYCMSHGLKMTEYALRIVSETEETEA